jgi:hypothetical protein
MLKGLALTPPILGRISIGRIVERNGKRLPEKDDEFTITSQVNGAGGWVRHPLDEALRKEHGAKLRSIPVSLLFNDPDLSLRAAYSLFDRKTGRPLCVGNGTTCRRLVAGVMHNLPCPTPEVCELAAGGACKPYGRMNVRIGEDDELGSFIFRTTGFNSIRTLSTRLKYFHAVSGGLLATLPLELRLRGKSTAQSHGSTIYYVDLTVRTGLTVAQAVVQARLAAEERTQSGFDQALLDEAARQGLANGAFEESAEDGAAVVEEFYSATAASGGEARRDPGADAGRTLAEKLERKASGLTEPREAVGTLEQGSVE